MPSSSGGVRLSGGPVLSEAETSVLESDVSSIISISDALQVSDTEEEGGMHALEDKKKYRLPDVGKTRLNLHTKEPLSASPLPQQQPAQLNSPTTPRTARSGTNGGRQSPTGYGFPAVNGSQENVSDGDAAVSARSRAGSIYTLGRASLQGQLSQLMSMKLPDAGSLAKRIADIPTSAEAAKVLSDASEQIRLWISKVSDVLNGLNAEDDIEWAAAGGREGIDDVDSAITRFEKLIEVYLVSIDQLQTRDDISSLSEKELKDSVHRMESIVASWQKVKDTLDGVKEQVELAMDWELLWNSVLGEVALEMEALNRLVFEMEEKRHQGAESLLSSKDSIDLGELETIVEERPRRTVLPTDAHLAMSHFLPTTPLQPPLQNDAKEDSSLLALFARMQPLRASLDFLPMRLAVFNNRGEQIFPSACQDLDQRRNQLEEQWVKLESDAESLRRELGEDRWVLVFRNAGRQALKMCESITRSYSKLKDAVDTNEQQTSAASFSKKVESYEAKKMHYGPAIERVLAIIDRGVVERLTVNGEILRLQDDMKQRWTGLQDAMKDIDVVIEEYNNDSRDKQLRDSVSTVMSSERSVNSSLVDTPGSSPASSVVGTSRKSSFHGSRTPTPLTNSKTRASSIATRSRVSSVSSIPRRIPLTQSSSPVATRSTSPSPLTIRANGKQPTRHDPLRPRWSGATRVESRDFPSLSKFEPSPYAKTPVTKKTNFLRSTRAASASPMTPASKSPATPSSLPTPSKAPLYTPSRSGGKSSLPVPTTLSSKRSSSTLRTSTGFVGSAAHSTAVDGNEADSESPSHHKSRSPSHSGRQSSLLTRRPRSRLDEVRIGVVIRSASGPMGRTVDERPRWRP